MLKNLSIKNIGLISDLSVEFGEGFNVLTGETGAGKSMILSALNLILGGRADPDVIKKGGSGCMATALFDKAGLEETARLLEEQGIYPEEGEFIIRRTLQREGKSRALVNGSSVNISALKRAGEAMVDIHGQHDHQALLKEETHLQWLDHYLGTKRESARIAELFSKTRKLSARLNKLIEKQRELSAQKEYLEYKLDELVKASLQPGEDVSIESEQRKLAGADELRQTGLEVFEKIYESDGSVLSELEVASKAVERLAGMDSFFEQYHKKLSAIAVQLSEAAMEMQSHCSSVESDPARLEALEDRQALVEQLKRKYKKNFDELVRLPEETENKLASIEYADEEREAVASLLSEARNDLQKNAELIHKKRLKGISAFKKEVQKKLFELNMPSAKFEVQVSLAQDEEHGFELEGEKRRMFPRGFGEFRFLISANEGQEPKPLAKIASGGEISRIMLALKSAVGKSQPVPVLVFDEIDAGIGGKTADLVGAKLAKLAKNCQIICITHLQQIARQADHHYVVEKTVKKGQTFVSIKKLDNNGRVEELARMGAGREITEAARKHAREMIKK